jgi:hypothetical protein
VFDPEAKERRDYVLDAWADVAVTCAFVLGTLLVAALRSLLKDESRLETITINTFEVGFMIAVINHVLGILWNRTYLGKILRWLFGRQRPRPPGEGGDPGRAAREIGRRSPFQGRSPFRPPASGDELRRLEMRLPIPQRGRFATVYPQAGGALRRSIRSFYIAVAGAIGCFAYLLFTTSSPEAQSANGVGIATEAVGVGIGSAGLTGMMALSLHAYSSNLAGAAPSMRRFIWLLSLPAALVIAAAKRVGIVPKDRLRRK